MTCAVLSGGAPGHEGTYLSLIARAGLPTQQFIAADWPPNCSTEQLGMGLAIARPSLEGPYVICYMVSFELTRVLSGDVSAWASEVESLARSIGVRPVAALFQPIPEARASGVAYTLDPVTGERLVVVQSVVGIHARLLAGGTPHDTFILDRGDLDIVEARVLAKPRYLAVRGGVMEDIQNPEPERPSISDNEAREVAELALRAEGVIGSPVEVEWAISGAGPIMLAARPIPAQLVGLQVGVAGGRTTG